jgi:ABC-type spermidine/putrescine transport system permease subunit II
MTIASRLAPNVLRALLLALLAFVIFGPLLNLVLWAFAERWYFPSKLPWRGLILLAFLLPQAVPNLPVYVNIAQVFYQIGLAGTITGVVLVHASHGLVLAVWIASAAFASIDGSLEEAARNLGASAWTCFRTVTLPLAAPGLMASAIFVFLESLDEFTGTYFVGVPDVTTLPLLMFNASMGGNYQIASITALLLLVPSIAFMLVVERFLKADVLAMVGR